MRDVRKYEVFKRRDQIHLASALSVPTLGVLGDLGGSIRVRCLGYAPATGLLARVTGRSAKL